jgi:hypothetical protein
MTTGMQKSDDSNEDQCYGNLLWPLAEMLGWGLFCSNLTNFDFLQPGLDEPPQPQYDG